MYARIPPTVGHCTTIGRQSQMHINGIDLTIKNVWIVHQIIRSMQFLYTVDVHCIDLTVTLCMCAYFRLSPKKK